MKTFLIASSIVLLAGCEAETAFDKCMKVREPEAYEEVALKDIDGIRKQWKLALASDELVDPREEWLAWGRSIPAWENGNPTALKNWTDRAKKEAAKICNDQGLYE